MSPSVIYSQVVVDYGFFVTEPVMMFIMAIVMTGDQIIHIKSNVPIQVVLFVEFFQMVYRCSFGNDLATEIADGLVSVDHGLSYLLPIFSLV